MRAVQVTRTNGPSSVSVVDIDQPDIVGGQIAIQVRAAGVNFPDLLYTRGEYQIKPNLPFVLGQECAGVVIAAPEGSGFQAGDRVAAYCHRWGAFADVVVVPPDAVLPLPDSVSYEVGASLVVNYLTAHFALVRRGGLVGDQSVLVHGATGGVGSAAVQIAADAGARVVAVVSTEEKAKLAFELGAHDVVFADHFRDSVRELIPDGVDLVFGPVGDPRFTDSVRTLATFGKVLVIGFAGGGIPSVKVNRLLLTNTDVVGAGWGAVASDPGYISDQWVELMPGISSGRFRPIIAASFPLERAAEAISLLESRHAGKSVLQISSDNSIGGIL